MFSEKLIRNTIKQCIDSGIGKFAIYPFGENGMAVKNCMEQCFGISSVMVVDNGYSQYNANIFSIDELRKNYDKDVCIILTAEDRTLNQKLKEGLLSFVPEDRIVNLRDSIIQIEEKRKKLENSFSLQNILPQRKKVFCVQSSEEKIKVRFIHATYVMWNSMRTICEQFEEDPRFDVLVICCSDPKAYTGYIDSRIGEIKNQMETEQHRYVMDSQYSAKDDQPDILIVSGYGGADRWCPRGVREYTRIIAVVPVAVQSYMNSIEAEWQIVFSGYEKHQPDYYLVDSMLFNVIRNSHFYSDRFVEMGNPKFDEIFNACQRKSYIAGWEKLKGKRTIFWSTTHGVHGPSGTNTDLITFDLYAKQIFTYAVQHPHMGFIFRPHPFLMQELIHFRYWTENDLADIKRYCDESPNIVWDETHTYESAYSVADAVMTDVCCGIAVSALPTLKPICVLYSNEEIVPPNKEVVENCYSVHCEKELTDFFDMVQEGKDPMLEQRREISKRWIKHFDGRNGERIKNFIAQAYDAAVQSLP